jgi:hypothetical protein
MDSVFGSLFSNVLLLDLTCPAARGHRVRNAGATGRSVRHRLNGGRVRGPKYQGGQRDGRIANRLHRPRVSHIAAAELQALRHQVVRGHQPHYCDTYARAQLHQRGWWHHHEVETDRGLPARMELLSGHSRPLASHWPDVDHDHHLDTGRVLSSAYEPRRPRRGGPRAARDARRVGGVCFGLTRQRMQRRCALTRAHLWHRFGGGRGYAVCTTALGDGAAVEHSLP